MKLIKKLSLLIIISILSIPSIVFGYSHLDWDGSTPYIIVNNNIPFFTEAEKQSKEHFIQLSPLDSLGRTGPTFMNITKENLPKDNRENIGSVEPSGWRSYNDKGKLVSNNSKYPGVVSGNYIYNRCHQLPYQASGLNAENKNLFTGTRYINVVGQLPFEDDATKYVKKTGNHCLYRCTPIFEGNNLICEGVILEAYSVEDNGQGISFNVFCPNIQPGIVISYADGKNWLEKDAPEQFKQGYTSSNNITYNDPFNPTTQNTQPNVIDNNQSPIIIQDNQANNEDSDIIIIDNNDINTTNKNNTNNPLSKLTTDTSNTGRIILLVIAIWFLFFRGGGGSNQNYSNRR